jgi:hypothetical protein
MIDEPTEAQGRRAGDPRGAVAGLAFGCGHGVLTKGVAGHRFHGEA